MAFVLHLWYFNPLPRKEGDTLLRHNDCTILISIRSLVKRETDVPTVFVDTGLISIRSLVKRETPSLSEDFKV